MLDLLALVEHEDALPPEAVLRLGREIMTLIAQEPAPLHCEAVAAPADGIPSER